MRQGKNADISVEDKDGIENPYSFGGGKMATSSSDLTFTTRRVFMICVAMRMANALLVQTYFNPDEHWQALEVAHCVTFGYK